MLITIGLLISLHLVGLEDSCKMLKEEEIDLLRSFRSINQEMKIFAGGHLTKTGPNVDGISCFSYDNNRNFSIKFIEPRVTDGEHRFFVIL